MNILCKYILTVHTSNKIRHLGVSKQKNCTFYCKRYVLNKINMFGLREELKKNMTIEARTPPINLNSIKSK